MSGTHNKVADCLSWLVDVKDTPVNLTASMNMLVTSTTDGPVTCTPQQDVYPTDTTPPTAVKSTLNTDKVNAPPPLTEDCKDTLWPMQKTDPFCKCISKRLLNGKAPSHEVDTFMHIKGILYIHVVDSNKKFLALVIPKSWHVTVLLEAHDKFSRSELSSHQMINNGKEWIRPSINTSLILHCVKVKG